MINRGGLADADKEYMESVVQLSETPNSTNDSQQKIPHPSTEEVPTN